MLYFRKPQNNKKGNLQQRERERGIEKKAKVKSESENEEVMGAAVLGGRGEVERR